MPDKSNPDPEITGDARIDELLARVHKTSIGKSVSASEWDEIVTWINENMITEDQIMKEYTCGRVTGMENARDLATACLLDTAAEIFKLGKDDEQAQQLRNLSKKVKDYINTHTPKPPPKT